MTTLEHDMSFHFPAADLPRLEKALQKLNKTADKLDCAHVQYEIVSRYNEVAPAFRDQISIVGEHNLPKIEMIEVCLIGEGPKLEGWKFLGTLDHYSIPGSVIVNTVPGEKIPSDFHHNDAVCDHCGKTRRRIETFILEHESGEQLQVGRQCIKDFLGHDVRQIANFMRRLNSIVDDFADADNWLGGGSFNSYVYEHDVVLQATIAIINRHGWVSSKAARESEGELAATSSDVRYFLEPPRDGKALEDWREWVRTLDYKSEKVKNEVEAARQWLKEQEDTNEYMHNLKTIDQAELVPAKMIGYWCSLIAAYRKAMERLEVQKAERAKMLNEYAGKVKDRIETNVKVISIKHIEGYYGVVRLVRMIDEDGRTLIWFANTDTSMESANQYKIKGTIKKLDEYNNWKQTVLTRVKVLEEVN